MADRANFGMSYPRLHFPHGGIVASLRTGALIEALYGKPQVNILRVGCEMRLGKTHSAPRQAQLSTAWVQTAAFLQQAQKTIELGLPRLWKCRVLLGS